jgi:hypothetical protein
VPLEKHISTRLEDFQTLLPQVADVKILPSFCIERLLPEASTHHNIVPEIQAK